MVVCAQTGAYTVSSESNETGLVKRRQKPRSTKYSAHEKGRRFSSVAANRFDRGVILASDTRETSLPSRVGSFLQWQMKLTAALEEPSARKESNNKRGQHNSEQMQDASPRGPVPLTVAVAVPTARAAHALVAVARRAVVANEAGARRLLLFAL